MLAGNFAEDRIEKLTSYIACFPPLLIPGSFLRTAFKCRNCSQPRIKKDVENPVTPFMKGGIGDFT